jgi:capsid protein
MSTEHVDPVKEANSQKTRLASHTTTLASEYAREGCDWEAELRQRAKERQLMKKLGLSGADAAPKRPPADGAEDEDEVPNHAAADAT